MSATLPIVTNDRTVTLTATVAGQTAFPFDFPVQFETDLRVSIAPAATPEAFAALSFAAGAYTVAGAGAAAGGTITLQTGCAIGDRVQIDGASLIDRTSSIVRGGAFRSDAIDADFDRLVMISQELRRDIDAAALAIAVVAAQLAAFVENLPTAPDLENWRMRRALAASGAFWTVDQTIPADPSDPLAIAWAPGTPVPVGGRLWLHIAAKLDWGDAEMAAFLTLALEMDP